METKERELDELLEMQASDEGMPERQEAMPERQEAMERIRAAASPGQDVSDIVAGWDASRARRQEEEAA